jgi:hypothetical protein
VGYSRIVRLCRCISQAVHGCTRGRWSCLIAFIHCQFWVDCSLELYLVYFHILLLAVAINGRVILMQLYLVIKEISFSISEVLCDFLQAFQSISILFKYNIWLSEC